MLSHHQNIIVLINDDHKPVVSEIIGVEVLYLQDVFVAFSDHRTAVSWIK